MQIRYHHTIAFVNFKTCFVIHVQTSVLVSPSWHDDRDILKNATDGSIIDKLCDRACNGTAVVNVTRCRVRLIFTKLRSVWHSCRRHMRDKKLSSTN